MSGNKWLVFFLSCFFFISGSLSAVEEIPLTLREVGIDEHLETQIPLALPFIDQDGNAVSLKDYFFKDKAVLLNLAYYSCPMLCHMVVSGIMKSLSGLTAQLGTDFEVVTVSVDPKDTPELAGTFKERYMTEDHGDIMRPFWHFLVGQSEPITQLAESVGFKYRYNEKTSQFAHSAGLIFISPDGVVKRYLYGLDYSSFDVKMAVLETLGRRNVTPVEKLLLFCYNYDPQSKKYVKAAQQLMKLGGVVTIIVMGIILVRTIRRNQYGRSS